MKKMLLGSVFIVSLFLAACSGNEKYGAGVDPDAPKVEVKDIFLRPDLMGQKAAGVKLVVASVSLCRFATKVLFGGPFPFRVKSYYFNRFPVSSLPGPTTGILLSCLLINVFPFFQLSGLSPIMPIIRRHKAYFTMLVLGVVPMNECVNPPLGLVLGGKWT